MPELPEVENVKRSLEAHGLVGQVIKSVSLLRPNLRTPLSANLVQDLPGQVIKKISRRAKYLLFETDHYLLLNHLGMTGAWRWLKRDASLKKHDHVLIHFQSRAQLVYNDPRRFGLVEILKKENEEHSKWLSTLGPEPLGPTFDTNYLYSASRKRNIPIKALIMDQKIVVGVGNIYASEALYRAKIRPRRMASRIKRLEAEKLVESIQVVLREAIEAGGSTISDYRQADGAIGGFQKRFRVYDRKDELCLTCGAKILSAVISGRNSFWCPKCQC